MLWVSLAEGEAGQDKACLGPSIVCEARQETEPFVCRVTHQTLWWPLVLTSPRLQGHVMETDFSLWAGCDVIVEGGREKGRVNSSGLPGWPRADKLPLALKAQQLPTH